MNRVFIVAALALLFGLALAGWVAFAHLFAAGGPLAGSPGEVRLVWLAGVVALSSLALYAAVPDRWRRR